jgi:hypothetical protein
VTEADSRRCHRCGETRPITMFYVAIEARRVGGHAHWHCRFCQREINSARRRPRQDYVDAIKLANGCADCGLRSPHPEIYDFDHLPGFDKVASVSALLTKGTFDDLVAEVAKCDVVCANCHRIRTRSREAAAFGRSWSCGSRRRSDAPLLPSPVTTNQGDPS